MRVLDGPQNADWAIVPLIAGGEDVGWEGAWEPMVVGRGTLNELRNLCGVPVRKGSEGTGMPYEWCAVNVKTMEFRYPVPTPPSGGPS